LPGHLEKADSLIKSRIFPGERIIVEVGKIAAHSICRSIKMTRGSVTIRWISGKEREKDRSCPGKNLADDIHIV
jgi:hypothetical protein